MDQILLFSLLGLGTGALIAGVAISLVVFYRGAGVINLAAGAVSMLAGYSYWALKMGKIGGTTFGTFPALVITFVVIVAIAFAMEFTTFRPLRNATPMAKLVGSLGLLLTAQAAMLLAFGKSPQTEPAILPTTSLQVASVSVPIDRFILTGLVIVAAVGLTALYRWTRFGLSTRAASESEASALLAGLSPHRLSLYNTLIGSLAAGVLGVLAAPLISLDTTALPLIVVPALAAALLARFTSVIGACIWGLLIGVSENLLYYASAQTWFPTDKGVPMPGVAELLVFVVILIAMFWRGGNLPGRGDIVEQRLPLAPRPDRILAPAAIAAVVGVIALIVLPFGYRQALMNSMIGTVLVLSLVLITGFVGQISVMQLALSGVAGFVVSHVAVDLGIGFPIAPLLGAIVAVAFGLIAAIGALRVRGVSLAVITLAAAVAIENFGFNNSTWGGGQTGAPIGQPHFLGINLGNDSGFNGLDGKLPSPVLGFTILAFTIALCALVANIRRGSLGSRMLAVRSNERAAAAVGINVRNVKLTAFAIGSFIAGLAGALYGYNFGTVSAGRFSAVTALSLIAFAYIGGITMVSGALFAGFLATEGLSQYAFEKWFGLSGTWVVLMAGITLIFNVIFFPEGAAGTNYRKKMDKRRKKAAGLDTSGRIGALSGRRRDGPAVAELESPASVTETTK
jgi:branched-chain amino acid transport system permease protein